MINCLIVSAGDKIKKIRRKYNLKQEDLAGKDITRNLISEIENNKVRITRNTAEVIFKHLNRISQERNLVIEETIDYLMEDELLQATKILDDYIDELRTLSITKDGSFVNTLSEAEAFLMDWEVKDKKVVIYELAGDYFCNQNEMYKSVIYYEKALTLINKVHLGKQLLNILRKLSMVYGYIGKYSESIQCCEFALNNFYSMSKEDLIAFRHNNSMNYRHINNFEAALSNTKVIENLIDRKDTIRLFEVLNNKAVCLCKMKLYREALAVFNKLLNLVNEDYMDRYLIVLLNIVNLYWDIGMKDKAKENFDAVISRLASLSNNSSYMSDICFQIGKQYNCFGDGEQAEKFYLRALDFSEKDKNYTLANDVLCNLIPMYRRLNDSAKMCTIRYRSLSIFSKQEKVNHNVIYNLMLFYIENDAEMAKEIAKFVLRTNK